MCELVPADFVPTENRGGKSTVGMGGVCTGSVDTVPQSSRRHVDLLMDAVSKYGSQQLIVWTSSSNVPQILGGDTF